MLATASYVGTLLIPSPVKHFLLLVLIYFLLLCLPPPACNHKQAKRITAMAAAYDIMVIPHGSSSYSYHLQVNEAFQRNSHVALQSPPPLVLYFSLGAGDWCGRSLSTMIR